MGGEVAVEARAARSAPPPAGKGGRQGGGGRGPGVPAAHGQPEGWREAGSGAPLSSREESCLAAARAVSRAAASPMQSRAANPAQGGWLMPIDPFTLRRAITSGGTGVVAGG